MSLRYSINELIFDYDDRLLSYADKQISLDPRISELLLCLLQTANQVICRDHLMHQVWQGQLVSDHALTQSISELRKAFVELSPEFKILVKTVPKRGYKLVADVTEIKLTQFTGDAKTELIDVQKVTTKTFFPRHIRQTVITLLSMAFCVLVAVFWLQGRNHNPPVPNQVIEPNWVALRVFTSADDKQHLAFGLSDLINYRINSLSQYRSSLIYTDNSDFMLVSGVIISGEIESTEGLLSLTLTVFDNLTNSMIFTATYPLTAQHLLTTPGLILNDISLLLGTPFDTAMVARTERQYPAQLEVLNWMYEAHYALNKVQQRSLHHAVQLYQRVLTNSPTLEIAAAEQLLAMRLLRDTEANSISLERYQASYQHLSAIKSANPPPVYYEALAIYAFDAAKLELAESYLQQALAVRDSWLGNILVGKIAETRGLDFQASRAYTRAYILKPDRSTLRSMQYLLFVSDVSALLPHVTDTANLLVR